MSNLTKVLESIDSQGAGTGAELYSLYEVAAQKFDSTNQNLASQIREEGLRRASALMKGGKKTRKLRKKSRAKKTRKH